MANPLKVKIELLMDKDDQELRRKAHESLPLPEFAKDSYLYRIGLDAHLKMVEARREQEQKDRSLEG